jgi:small subunit ribosomal protein S4
MHGLYRRKLSDYKARLLEKQKLRFAYWVSERQFRGYVKRAFKTPGVTGENLLQLLERRLDNLVYRLGFAPTIPAARQLVAHGHVTVNGRKMDRPSYLVEPGTVISLKETSKSLPLVKDGLVRGTARPTLLYLEVDRDAVRGRLVAVPRRSEIPLPVDDGLVVEFYQKYL